MGEMKFGIVTEEMISAGNEIASKLMDIKIAGSMHGLGGSETVEEVLRSAGGNRDLVQANLDDEIDSVTAIFIAMHRVSQHKGDQLS